MTKRMLRSAGRNKNILDDRALAARLPTPPEKYSLSRDAVLMSVGSHFIYREVFVPILSMFKC